MKFVTVGKKYNKGKVAYIYCEKNAPIENISIKRNSFLLIILTKGKINFSLSGLEYSATAPSFICFDEKENPIFDIKQGSEYITVYFHPKFLNVNMCFELLRSANYSDIATTHDMFMLRPFIDGAHIIPISDNHIAKIRQSAEYMIEELSEQRDWYWSCRGRSYFMEIIIYLERMYGLIGYGKELEKTDNSFIIEDSRLRDAVLYIESNYSEELTLTKISSNVGVNQTVLTALMRKSFGCTVMEYVKKHRILVAKKQLAFTDVPIKDIANMVGFKTVQHFSRVFKEHTNVTPAEFRKVSVEKRKKEFY